MTAILMNKHGIKLTAKALQMAYHNRLKAIGMLFHSNQGTHYTSQTFAEARSAIIDYI
ncbi:hypothetical protein [Psychrobacter glacincola]|uniref:hypothetical protein n=1 Tax=Psychrobacter glacincola TaxID=56810 RepID=UPI003BB6D4F0